MFKNTEELCTDLHPKLRGLFQRMVAQAIAQGVYGGLACGGAAGTAYLVDAGPAFDDWFQATSDQLSALLGGGATPGIPAALLVEEPELCAFLLGKGKKVHKTQAKKKPVPNSRPAPPLEAPASTPASLAALTQATAPPALPAQGGLAPVPAPAPTPGTVRRDEPAA